MDNKTQNNGEDKKVTSNKLKAVYKHLKRKDSVTGLGSGYSEFETKMKNSGYSNAVYEYLKKDSTAKGLPETYDGFMEMNGLSVKEPPKDDMGSGADNGEPKKKSTSSKDLQPSYGEPSKPLEFVDVATWKSYGNPESEVYKQQVKDFRNSFEQQVNNDVDEFKFYEEQKQPPASLSELSDKHKEFTSTIEQPLSRVVKEGVSLEDVNAAVSSPTVREFIGKIKNGDLKEAQSAVDLYNASLSDKVREGDPIFYTAAKIADETLKERIKETKKTPYKIQKAQTEAAQEYANKALEEGVITEEDLNDKNFTYDKLVNRMAMERAYKKAQADNVIGDNAESFYDLSLDRQKELKEMLNGMQVEIPSKVRGSRTEIRDYFGDQEEIIRGEMKTAEKERFREYVPEEYQPSDWEQMTDSDKELVKLYEQKIYEEFGVRYDLTGDNLIGEDVNPVESGYFKTGEVMSKLVSNLELAGYNALKFLGENYYASGEFEVPKQLDALVKKGMIDERDEAYKNIRERTSKDIAIRENESLVDALKSGDLNAISDISSNVMAESSVVLAGTGIATASGATPAMAAGYMMMLASAENYIRMQDQDWFQKMTPLQQVGYSSMMGGAEGISSIPVMRAMKPMQAAYYGAKQTARKTAKESLLDIATGRSVALGKAVGEGSAGEGFTSLTQSIVTNKFRDKPISFEETLAEVEEGMAAGGAMSGKIAAISMASGIHADWRVKADVKRFNSLNETLKQEGNPLRRKKIMESMLSISRRRDMKVKGNAERLSMMNEKEFKEWKEAQDKAIRGQEDVDLGLQIEDAKQDVKEGKKGVEEVEKKVQKRIDEVESVEGEKGEVGELNKFTSPIDSHYGYIDRGNGHEVLTKEEFEAEMDKTPEERVQLSQKKKAKNYESGESISYKEGEDTFQAEVVDDSGQEVVAKSPEGNEFVVDKESIVDENIEQQQAKEKQAEEAPVREQAEGSQEAQREQPQEQEVTGRESRQVELVPEQDAKEGQYFERDLGDGETALFEKTAEGAKALSDSQAKKVREAPQQKTEPREAFKSKASKSLDGMRDAIKERRAEIAKQKERGETGTGGLSILTNPQVEDTVLAAAEKAVDGAKTLTDAADMSIDAGIKALRDTDLYKGLKANDKVKAEGEVRDMFDVSKPQRRADKGEAAKPKKSKRKKKAELPKNQRERLDDINKKVKDLSNEAVNKNMKPSEVKKSFEGKMKEYIDSLPDLDLTPAKTKALTKKGVEAASRGTSKALRDFAAYSERVVQDKDYENKVAKAKKNAAKVKKKKASKKSPYPIDSGEVRAFSRVDVDQLTLDQLDAYNELAERLASDETFDRGLLSDIGEFARLSEDQALDRARERQIKAEKEISPEKFKEKKDSAKLVKQSAKNAKGLSRLEQTARDFINSVKKIDIESLADNDNITNSDLKELFAGIQAALDSDIGQGFFASPKAYTAIREASKEQMKKDMDKALENKEFKKLLRNHWNFDVQKMRGKITNEEAYLNWIRTNPLYRIDAALKGKKGLELYKTVIEPISTKQSLFDSVLREFDRESDKATRELSKGLSKIPYKRGKQFAEADAKLLHIALEARKIFNKKAGYPSAKEYIDATVNNSDDKTKISKEYIAAKASWEKLPKTKDGELDYEKAMKSLSKEEASFLNFWVKVANGQKEMARAAAAQESSTDAEIQEFYIPISTVGTEYNRMTEAVNSVSAFTKEGNMTSAERASMKSGNLKELTNKAQPIRYSLSQNVKEAHNSVLMSYHLREPIRAFRGAVNKFKADPNINDDAKSFVSALDESITKVTENLFSYNKYLGGIPSSKVMRKLVTHLKEMGYYSDLAGGVRAFQEGTSNIGYAALYAPVMTTKGTGIASKFMFDKGKRKDLGKFLNLANTSQYGRLFQTSQSIMMEEGIKEGEVFNNPLTKGSKYINNLSQTFPDQSIALPLWLGAMDKYYKKITGENLDINEFNKEGQYYEKNKDAVNEARVLADQKLAQGFATLNPYEGIIASQVTPDDKWWEIPDKYMTRFRRAEVRSAFDAVDAIMGNNHMSRAEGVTLGLGTITRMATYNALGAKLSTAAFNGVAGLLGAAGIGEDYDLKEDDTDLWRLGARSTLGSVLDLFVLRRMGNLASIPFKEMIEWGNYSYGSALGLREDEYDPYKNSLAFTFVKPDPVNIKKNVPYWATKDPESSLPRLFGPYGAFVKSTFGAYKTSKKMFTASTQATRDKAENAFFKYRVPNLIATTVGLPLPKDIRGVTQRMAWPMYFKDQKNSTTLKLTEDYINDSPVMQNKREEIRKQVEQQREQINKQIEQARERLKNQRGRD